MFRRAVAVLGAAAVIIGAASFAEARAVGKAARHKRTSHMLRETESQTTLSTSGSHEVNVGTLDGKIGGKSVHGAIRAVGTFAGPGKGTAKRTEFDQFGSRTASLTFTIVTNPDGSKTDTGGGHWTGGTGRYRGATGSFTFRGTIPKGSSTVTAVWTGTIVY